MSKYKVGDKFIVEIEETICGYGNNPNDTGHITEPLHRIKGFNTLVFDSYGLDKLQKYEEEVIATKFYEKGRQEALEEVQNCESYGYEKGLQDAWELARKISEIPLAKRREILSTEWQFLEDILKDFTPQEALAKIEAYEDSKAIKVGDVVKVDGTNKDCGIVIAIDEIQKKARLMYADTSFRVNEWYLADLKKTGRHLDIEHLLEQIRGNE